MHTSQHLLPALLETRLDLLNPLLVAHESPPCYVQVPRGMTPSEIASVQNEATRLVFEGRKVQELDQGHEQKETVRILDSGRSVGKAFPDDR